QRLEEERDKKSEEDGGKTFVLDGVSRKAIVRAATGAALLALEQEQAVGRDGEITKLVDLATEHAKRTDLHQLLRLAEALPARYAAESGTLVAAILSKAPAEPFRSEEESRLVQRAEQIQGRLA